MNTKTYYKVLAEDGSAHHGGSGKWPLPKNEQPGEWLNIKGEIIPCLNGLHVCEKLDLVHWLGPAIFVCEIDGEIVRDANKSVVAKARLVSRIDTWNERTARLFAADCAEKAIRDWEKASGLKCDPRSREAIRAAREFANGNMTEAAYSAARSAARSAAYSSAYSDACKWQKKRLFEYLDGKRG